MADSTKTTRSSKRKRTQVSYSADEYFDALDMDSNEAAAEVAGGDKLSPDDVDQAADDGDDRPEDGEFTRNGKGKAPPKKKVKKAPQSKKRKPKDEKPFRFMDLPPELRDEIYDLCLTEPGGLVLVSKRKDFRKTIVRGIITTETGKAYRGKYRREKPHRRWGYYQPPAMVRGKVKNYGSNISPDQKLVPNLLAVNKQIREEASSVLYKQNIMLEDTIALFNFMTTIGDYNRQLVSTLIIKGWGQGDGKADAYNHAAFAMLSTCKNIQSLFLDCTFYRYTTPDDLANTFYRTAHVFLEALCDAKGDIDDAVDVIRLAEWNYNRTRVKADKESTTVEGSTEDGSAKEGSAKEGSAKAGSAKYRPAENVEQEFNQALSDLLQARCRRR